MVNDGIFAVRVESQCSPETSVDWRRNLDGIPYSIETDLPSGLTDCLMTFHSSSGLVYGAYDFIVTPENEYIFLEVNNVGQWLWVPVCPACQSALNRRRPPR